MDIKYKNQKGFTLIELLIVIVIIGLLAGVLLTVLNPVQQQNRARDASLRATMNKIVLATKAQAATSTNGALPTTDIFITGVANINDTGFNDCDGSAATCHFTMTGATLPQSCVADTHTGVPGTNTAPCVMGYFTEALTNPQQFRLAINNFANPQGIMVYAYEQDAAQSGTDEGFFLCDIGTAVDSFALFTDVQDLRDEPNCTAM